MLSGPPSPLMFMMLLGAGSSGGGGGAPAAPTNLVAVAGNQIVGLTWDASAGATSYKIYHSLTNDFGTATEALESPEVGTSLDVSAGLQAGELYYFWVVASNASGDSAESTPDSARPYVTIGSSQTLNLTTPSGSFTIGTVLFSTTSPPSDYAIGFGAVTYFWDTVNWLNGDTFEPADSTPISGAFSLQSTSTGWTFWNTEP